MAYAMHIYFVVVCTHTRKGNTMETDIKQAAAAMGRIGGKSRSARKHASSQANMLKAQKASTQISAEAKRERAKKAAEARWKKAKKST